MALLTHSADVWEGPQRPSSATRSATSRRRTLLLQVAAYGIYLSIYLFIFHLLVVLFLFSVVFLFACFALHPLRFFVTVLFFRAPLSAAPGSSSGKQITCAIRSCLLCDSAQVSWILSGDFRLGRATLFSVMWVGAAIKKKRKRADAATLPLRQ